MRWTSRGATRPIRCSNTTASACPADECRAWETKLRQDGANTRVRCLYHFVVTVHEQAGGKRLYQGPFYHQVEFLLDDDKLHGPDH